MNRFHLWQEKMNLPGRKSRQLSYRSDLYLLKHNHRFERDFNLVCFSILGAVSRRPQGNSTRLPLLLFPVFRSLAEGFGGASSDISLFRDSAVQPFAVRDRGFSL